MLAALGTVVKLDGAVGGERARSSDIYPSHSECRGRNKLNLGMQINFER